MDSNYPVFVMLCGLPGSGKSTYAQILSKKINAIICSSDAIRAEICGSENSQEKNDEVFNILHNRIKESLHSGNNVIYDACNISSKRRKAFLNELKNILCVKRCIIIATEYDKCLEQNKKRERTVPEDVIKRMYLNWNTPYWFEGWDDIEFYFPYEEDEKHRGTDVVYALNLMNFDQDNPHHKLTLGKHLLNTGYYITDNYPTYDLIVAAYLHDIGKPFTKARFNSKGEPTEESHYYQHHCCGSYDVMFFNILNKLDVSILVNLHMTPYFWEKDNNEKMRLKYKKLWGDKLYDKVMLLHEADKAAH